MKKIINLEKSTVATELNPEKIKNKINKLEIQKALYSGLSDENSKQKVKNLEKRIKELKLLLNRRDMESEKALKDNDTDPRPLCKICHTHHWPTDEHDFLENKI